MDDEPLLPKSIEKDLLKSKNQLRPAFKNIMKLAGPGIITGLLEHLPSVIAILIISSAGILYIDAIGLAFAWEHIVSIGISKGFSAGLDTLASQAHGAGQDAGLWLQRAMLYSLALFIPISTALWFTNDFLLAISVESDISAIAGTYGQMIIPSIIFLLIFESLARYLHSIRVFWLELIIFGINGILYIGYTVVLVNVAGLREKGLAIAMTIYWSMNCAMMLTGMWWYRLLPPNLFKIRWTGLFSDFLVYGKYAVPALMLLWIDYFTFEIMQYEAARLGPMPQAAHVATANIYDLLYSLDYMISLAVASLVGNLLGMGLPDRAKFYSKASIILALCYKLPLTACVALLRAPISQMYIDDEETLQLTSFLMLITLGIGVLDWIGVIMCGILSGLGKQRYICLIYFLWSYFAAIPVGYVLAFVANMEIFGIWIGLAVGQILQIVWMGMILAKTKWEAETIIKED